MQQMFLIKGAEITKLRNACGDNHTGRVSNGMGK